MKSYIFAIVGAEYILRWLPIGTHEWEKFLKPKLISILEKNDLKLDKVNGMNFNLIKNKWSVGDDESVNYIAVLKINYFHFQHGTICASIPLL